MQLSERKTFSWHRVSEGQGEGYTLTPRLWQQQVLVRIGIGREKVPAKNEPSWVNPSCLVFGVRRCWLEQTSGAGQRGMKFTAMPLAIHYLGGLPYFVVLNFLTD